MKAFYSYVAAKYKEKNEDVIYRTYVTDLLKAIAERQTVTVSERWYDLIYGDITKNEAETALNNFYSDFRGGE